MSKLSKILRFSEGGGVMFWCPGCDGAHSINVGDGSGPRWNWNENVDKPSFTPSILAQGETWIPPVTSENYSKWECTPWEQTKVATVCHSFVTDGQIQFLSDCTHELAGQTVPLPDFD